MGSAHVLQLQRPVPLPPTTYTVGSMPSRLTLTPSSSAGTDPAMLESALQLVNSLNAKRRARSSPMRSKYRLAPSRPAHASSSDEILHNPPTGGSSQNGPDWLLSALVTHEGPEQTRIHAPFPDARASDRLTMPFETSSAAAPWPSSSPLFGSDPFEHGQHANEEPKFLSDLSPTRLLADSPPSTPFRSSAGSSRPIALTRHALDESTLNALDGSDSPLASGELDTRQFWKQHAAPSIPPLQIETPDRDVFTAQMGAQARLPSFNYLDKIEDEALLDFQAEPEYTIAPALMNASADGQVVHPLQAFSGPDLLTTPSAVSSVGVGAGGGHELSSAGDGRGRHRPFIPPASSPFAALGAASHRGRQNEHLGADVATSNELDRYEGAPRDTDDFEEEEAPFQLPSIDEEASSEFFRIMGSQAQRLFPADRSSSSRSSSLAML
ncbi:hypothetical protein OC842_000503 [Tilletia horrida]|uniref:Uncharacterized protein n=1 Tax=Tilletia horrida TaxID=155126 RepID=A0AAN6GGP2_9BASI|nr:hypothetical protein OC842_000503 [Tilletia horrida]